MYRDDRIAQGKSQGEVYWELGNLESGGFGRSLQRSWETLPASEKDPYLKAGEVAKIWSQLKEFELAITNSAPQETQKNHNTKDESLRVEGREQEVSLKLSQVYVV